MDSSYFPMRGQLLDIVPLSPIPFIIAFSIIAFLIYDAFFDPLRKVPGPFWARWSRLWMIYHSRKGDMHAKMIELHKKYGKIVRTAPDEVSIDDPTAIKHIYGAGTKFRKSEWYGVWQGRRELDLFGERNEKTHSAHRRLVSQVYSMSSLKKLESNVDNALRVFLARMEDFSYKTIDMGRWAQMFAFDVVGEVTFSKSFGFLENGDDSGVFATIDKILEAGAWIGQVPGLFWLHERLAPIIGQWIAIGQQHSSLRIIANTAYGSRKRENDDGDQRDMLGQLLAVRREKPSELSEAAVMDVAYSNVFAGSDTTGISIGAVLYHLCLNPDSMQRLKAEVDANAHMVDAETGVFPFAIANAMPFLQACIWEGLRLHPAVGMTLPRVTPEGGFEIDGMYFPKGTVMGTNPWVIHHNQTIFGKDADGFRPERWLGENRGQLERYFFAFGSGARTCIGRNLSWIEMSKLIPSLLLRWDLHLVHNEAKPRYVCKWFVKQEDLYMTLRPRRATKQ